MANNASVALLLEDEPLISMDVEVTLEEAGFSVTTVMSCRDAEAWLNMCRPNVAIVDIELKDGLCAGVVERLIESDIPFIVHSGEHPSAYVGTPFARGVWLGKPAEPSVLANAARALATA